MRKSHENTSKRHLAQVFNITNKIHCTVEKDLLMLKSDKSAVEEIHFCNVFFHTTRQGNSNKLVRHWSIIVFLP